MEFIKTRFKEVRPSPDEENEVFLPAAKAGDTAFVESLLASTINLDYVEPKSGQNALHMFASACHEQTVQALVIGGVYLETKDINSKTALNLAVQGGNVAILEILLKIRHYCGRA